VALLRFASSHLRRRGRLVGRARPDNYWDLRYYHLYAPWAYLHDRYLYDVGPAQEQGFLNPIADLLFYGLISFATERNPAYRSVHHGRRARYQCRVLFAIAVTSFVRSSHWSG